MKKATIVLILLWLNLTVCQVSAHHAMEYIDLESTKTARPGEFLFHVHFDYLVDDADNPRLDHWEYTPGIAVGLPHHLMFDIHTHFAKFGLDHVVEEERENFEPSGPSPFMEAVAVTLQWTPLNDWILDIGLSGTMEIPFKRATDLLGSEDNVYEGMLMMGYDFWEHKNVTVNLGYEQEGDQDCTSWALGFRSPLSVDSHGIAAGIEFKGDLTGDEWSILPGIYSPVGHEGIIFKTGLEFGQVKTEAGTRLETLRVSACLMFSF
ncbi:hypothetical protein ACFL27_00605 [candidate division CSSED10-310 bacterium]|uniref:Transporter n=1 Tax=candidate division CSSED10-310 bacterium TaxID=2855610 RepID=A0ABV6YR45_UNCC1